jgi:hypothetical protein
MHRWFEGSWWTWPWPSWFFYKWRLVIAWQHLTSEQQAPYLQWWRIMGTAGGFTTAESAEAMRRLGHALGMPPS